MAFLVECLPSSGLIPPVYQLGIVVHTWETEARASKVWVHHQLHRGFKVNLDSVKPYSKIRKEGKRGGMEGGKEGGGGGERDFILLLNGSSQEWAQYLV